MTGTHLVRYQVRAAYGRRKLVDFGMRAAILAGAALVVLPLFGILSYLIVEGAPALDLPFFTRLPSPVGEAGGGMANALAGTATLVALACVLGVVWGVAVGLYLYEYGGGRLGPLIRFSADMLSAVPSIVIGLFIYAVVVLPLHHFSALAGGVALGIIMVPTVARCTEDLLLLTPTHIREAALALGLPRWRVILSVVLRGSRSGILTGIMLALARVTGETAPLLFTALNNRFWQRGLLEPIASLPVQIYTYAVSPFEEWHRQAWAGALVLVLVVFALNAFTRGILRLRGYAGEGRE